MAWTNPRTWVTGEVVTAALLNVQLRDNLLEVAKDGQGTAFPATPVQGQWFLRTDTGVQYRWDGTQWRAINSVATSLGNSIINMNGQVTSFTQANGIVYSRFGDTVVGQAVYSSTTPSLGGGASLQVNLPAVPRSIGASNSICGQWFANIRSEAGATVNKSGFLQFDPAAGWANCFSHAVDPATVLRVWPNGGTTSVLWNFSYIAV